MGIYKFNTPYVRNHGREFKPTYMPGETYSFFINTNFLVDDNNIPTNTFNLINQAGTIIYSFGLMDYVFVTPSAVQVYMNSFVFPIVPNGDYFFQVFDGILHTEVIRSNAIHCSSNAFNFTTYIKFRHNDQLFGVRYDLLPDFFQMFRLPINMIKSLDIKSDRTQYRESSNGRELRNTKSFRDIAITLEFYFADDKDFEAISALLEHSDIYIADNKISCELTQIKVEKVSEFHNLSKGTFDVIVDRYNIPFEDYGEFIVWGGNFFNMNNDFIIAE